MMIGAPFKKQTVTRIMSHRLAENDVFGMDLFGRLAERFARFFGTPIFLISQTMFVIVWISINSSMLSPFDPYPFILLNLLFSTQSAYAAPLILLAQTRQAERDKDWEQADSQHREELHSASLELLNSSLDNSKKILELTQRVEALLSEIHRKPI